AAAGPGGQPWLEVRDAVTQAPLYHFLAFDPTFRGGVFPASGDFNGDGKADILCGSGSGNDVSLFNGADDSPVARFASYGSSFNGGGGGGAGRVHGGRPPGERPPPGATRRAGPGPRARPLAPARPLLA